MSAPSYQTLAAVVVAFAVAALVVRLARHVIPRLLGDVDRLATEHRDAVRARAKQLTRALTILAYGTAALATISLALARLGFGDAQWDLMVTAQWLVRHGINVV